MTDKMINGPFGNYPWGSLGAALNSLSKEYGIPLPTVSNVTLNDGVVNHGGKILGYYFWDDEDGFEFIYAPSSSK